MEFEKFSNYCELNIIIIIIIIINILITNSGVGISAWYGHHIIK